MTPGPKLPPLGRARDSMRMQDDSQTRRPNLLNRCEPEKESTMPVWDNFLTDRDKAHLEATGSVNRRRKGIGKKPALLIVDDYYSVLGTEREDILESVKKWPM